VSFSGKTKKVTQALAKRIKKSNTSEQKQKVKGSK
jgi:hypothetical protein